MSNNDEKQSTTMHKQQTDEPAAPADGAPEDADRKVPLRERARERSDEEKMVRGRVIRRGDIFKIWGLVIFIVLVTLIVVLIWPYIKDLFGDGGVGALIDRLQSAGPAGVLILLALQFLQVVVAIIPGEVVQLAAGLMYGPFWGFVIILGGAVLSSAFIYQLVHTLGEPFVRTMVSDKTLEKFDRFQHSGKLDITVFILFLIPGLPKDAFTYLVPLTEMKMKDFLLITTIARAPGILGSTYVAAGLAGGHITSSIIVIVAVAVLAALGVAFREKIFDKLGKRRKSKDGEEKVSASGDAHEGVSEHGAATDAKPDAASVPEGDRTTGASSKKDGVSEGK